MVRIGEVCILRFRNGEGVGPARFGGWCQTGRFSLVFSFSLHQVGVILALTGWMALALTGWMALVLYPIYSLYLPVLPVICWIASQDVALLLDGWQS